MRQKNFLETVAFEKKKSKIHGTGVFTKTKIPALREFYIIPLNEVYQKPLPKMARIASNLFVNDPKVLNYVNHSCDPNSEIIIFEKKVFLKSKRKILQGEEITLDYCENEEKNNLIPCECRSKKCRNFFYIT